MGYLCPEYNFVWTKLRNCIFFTNRFLVYVINASVYYVECPSYNLCQVCPERCCPWIKRPSFDCVHHSILTATILQGPVNATIACTPSRIFFFLRQKNWQEVEISRLHLCPDTYCNSVRGCCKMADNKFFQEMYQPRENVATDEQMAKSRHRSDITQFKD